MRTRPMLKTKTRAARQNLFLAVHCQQSATPIAASKSGVITIGKDQRSQCRPSLLNATQ